MRRYGRFLAVSLACTVFASGIPAQAVSGELTAEAAETVTKGENVSGDEKEDVIRYVLDTDVMMQEGNTSLHIQSPGAVNVYYFVTI